MNRRDALKLLTALPMVKSIEVANVAPNDVIVVESDDYISDHGRDNIRRSIELVWPNRKIVVFDKGLRMRIVREACGANDCG